MLVRTFPDQVGGLVLQHLVRLDDLARLLRRPRQDQREVGQQAHAGYVLQGAVGFLAEANRINYSRATKDMTCEVFTEILMWG